MEQQHAARQPGRQWTEADWRFILADARCAREDVKLLRRMGANAVRRWAKRAQRYATEAAQ